MLNQNLIYGIISGISLSLWLLLEFFLGFQTSFLQIGKVTRIFAFIIPVIAIYIAIRQLKNLDEEDSFSILDGVKSAIIISLICVLIAGPFLYLYSHYMNSPWIESAADLDRDELIFPELSEEDIEVHKEEMRNIIWNNDQILEFFIYIPLVSLLSGTLFSAFILRKN